MGPYPTWGRKDRAIASLNQMSGGCRRLALPALGPGVLFVEFDWVSAVDLYGVVSEEVVRDMGRAQIRRGLGHRSYRLAHRTPALYSRNQSRTNIALLKKKDKRGGVSLPSCSYRS